MPYGVPQVELEPSRATGLTWSIGLITKEVKRNAANFDLAGDNAPAKCSRRLSASIKNMNEQLN